MFDCVLYYKLPISFMMIHTFILLFILASTLEVESSIIII